MTLPPALFRACALTCCAVLLGSGCKKPGAVASELTQAPDLADATGQAKCGVKKSAAKPLVVEWPAAERAALEAKASRSLVAVRYEGCDMEVLSNCSVQGGYDYLGLTQKREAVRINNADELYANLPVGAAGLEAKLERSGQLNVDMAIVGRLEADKTQFGDRDLQGRCDTATHVVTGLTVGAFSFYTGASADVAGGVKIGNIGAGVGSSSEQEVLRQDGDGESCGVASSSDEAAPEGCAALLRVEVVPIDRMGTSRPIPGTGLVATTTPAPAPTSAELDLLDKKIKRAKVGSFVSLGAAVVVGYVGGLAGFLIYSSAKNGIREDAPGDERQKAITRIKLGRILGWTGAGVGTVGLVMTYVFAARLKKLQAERRSRVSIEPMQRGAGISWQGRFAP